MNRRISAIITIVAFVVLLGFVLYMIQLDNEVFETTVGEESITIVGHGNTYEIQYDDIEDVSLGKGYLISEGYQLIFDNSRITMAHSVMGGNMILVFVDPMYTITIDTVSGPQHIINQSTDEATLALYEHLLTVTTEA